MSMMCRCLLVYDLFIFFLWFNMPKAPCFGYLQAEEDVCQSVKLENQTDCAATIYLCGEDNTNVGAHSHIHTCTALHTVQHRHTYIFC